jgi:hypothetical protein
MSTPTPLDFKKKAEIRSGLKRTRTLLESEIMWEHPMVLYRQSVLIEILVNLKDLLKKAEILGNRISFTDDVVPDTNPRMKINDVTDLISSFRDAACHNDSYRRAVGQGIISFSEMRGKGILFNISGKEIGCAYDDDIAIIMGDKVLYYKRHIERAFLEAEAFLEPISRFP